MREGAPFVPDAASERRGLGPDRAQTARRRREPPREKSLRASAIARHLADAYPGVECPLAHKNTFELLVAVILSAQCTDAAVNKVTPSLFQRYPAPAALSRASIADVESLIRTLGLFRAKARSLRRCAQQLVEEFNREVPAPMEELVRLGGVSRSAYRGHRQLRPRGAVPR